MSSLSSSRQRSPGGTTGREGAHPSTARPRSQAEVAVSGRKAGGSAVLQQSSQPELAAQPQTTVVLDIANQARVQIATTSSTRVVHTSSPMQPRSFGTHTVVRQQQQPQQPLQQPQQVKYQEPVRLASYGHEPVRLASYGHEPVRLASAASATSGASSEVWDNNVQEVDAAGRTRLMHIAGEGDVAALRGQIARGAVVNAVDECQCTALMYAATYGHIGAVQCLLEHGAGVEAKSRDGWTPLIASAYNGHLHVVRRLLECAACVEAADERGWTSLMHVAFSGDTETLRCLLAFHAQVDTLDCEGRNAVVYAAFNGHLANVRCLLVHGSQRAAEQLGGARDTARDTAFLFAAIRGHAEVLEQLVRERRYAPELETRHAAQKLAADHGHTAVVALLGRCAQAELAQDHHSA